ncbi:MULTISPECIES: ABC transporter ATP-binding protein [Micrococcaceae]|uniref:ABC transporter ATP-binding protein n=1 Tax=Micrococcaceae TaxID=1268 RepID=UPI001615D61C|nr:MULTISPECIES: ABC transporter ATP-binding protein [Micrococcaceae]MBB5748647.1 putative ABC transport system ATP-binding protein [Micrococcus sp. TA1]HRO31197.1 ABC transporter ATP-binding protein [Citricoccus sp.]HRO94326.1 ABC transporter ATP-binding protein [Citricoccus sp.]
MSTTVDHHREPAQDRSAPGPAGSLGLHLRDVTLEVGDGGEKVRALDHVDLSVAPGEFVAVIGPSGAGKSSLLAVAGALAAPTSGVVEVLGQDLAGLRGQGQLAAFRRRHLGFVFQSGNLVPALTAADQLRLARRIAHRGGRSRSFDPAPLLEAVDMGHRAGHRPGQLSGGERQRVGIARALVNQPSLLLVDEPTAALDRRRSQDIVALLARQCHQRGIAGVMVTHDHDVLDHCDRVVEMVDGRLVDRRSVTLRP